MLGVGAQVLVVQHRVQDAALHRLQAVAHVGQRARRDDAQRVVQVAAPRLGLERRVAVMPGVAHATATAAAPRHRRHRRRHRRPTSTSCAAAFLGLCRLSYRTSWPCLARIARRHLAPTGEKFQLLARRQIAWGACHEFGCSDMILGPTREARDIAGLSSAHGPQTHAARKKRTAYPRVWERLPPKRERRRGCCSSSARSSS